jgi:hypothetical protein
MKVGLAVTPGWSLAIEPNVDPTQLACIGQQPKMFGTDGQEFSGFRRC